MHFKNDTMTTSNKGIWNFVFFIHKITPGHQCMCGTMAAGTIFNPWNIHSSNFPLCRNQSEKFKLDSIEIFFLFDSGLPKNSWILCIGINIKYTESIRDHPISILQISVCWKTTCIFVIHELQRCDYDCKMTKLKINSSELTGNFGQNKIVNVQNFILHRCGLIISCGKQLSMSRCPSVGPSVRHKRI